jgi:hypothetical protein
MTVTITGGALTPDEVGRVARDGASPLVASTRCTLLTGALILEKPELADDARNSSVFQRTFNLVEESDHLGGHFGGVELAREFSE